MTAPDLHRRTVFCVSDHTGLTAESLAHSLMARFEGTEATYAIRPFIDSISRMEAVVAEISEVADRDSSRPIVFSTINDPIEQGMLMASRAHVVNLYADVTEALSTELGEEASRKVGGYHSVADAAGYQQRLDAIDFTLSTDDGLGIAQYALADIILVGVSRVGKTPTCLYLSMHSGIRAANYPIAIEEHPEPRLPDTLRPHRERLYGLTIDPIRLLAIRQQRRPDSSYASLEHCRREVAHTEAMFRAEAVPVINTSTQSVEEMAATIIAARGLTRRA